MQPQSVVTIQKEWDIVSARQCGRDLAKQLGFKTVDQARIATAISELARNIYLYTNQGEISFDIVENAGKQGIRINAVDTGPGIEDMNKVMEDGYSTSGGLGAGLSGTKRLMDEFDVQSEVGQGTKVKIIKWLR